MEEQLSTTTVVLNIGIQILNLVIFFLLFKFLLGDKLAKELEEREYLLKKIKNAETEYNDIIQKADTQKDNIIADAIQKQKKIIQEGELLNKKFNQEILEDAKKKANDIVNNASNETKRIQDELVKNREMAVKTTSKSVVKKILQDKPELQDTYLKTLIEDIEK
ncbi:MAG: hypothetical protein WCL18_01805 [bacterium]